jgi:GntR family transcriptional regulator
MEALLGDAVQHSGAMRHHAARGTLEERIRSLMRAGGFEVGEKFSTERQLSADLNVTRSDLRAALAKLESTHEIRRKIGRSGGIIVSDERLERNINTVESLPVIAKRQGFRLFSKVISATLVPASASDIRLLELPDDHPMVYNIVRLRMIDDMPLSVEISHLPSALFPRFLARDLTEPFYTMFERDYGMHPTVADETLESILSNGHESQLLEIPLRTPLMRIRRIARNDSGRPFERAIDVYIAARMRFTMHHSGYVRLSATAKETKESKEPKEPNEPEISSRER